MSQPRRPVPAVDSQSDEPIRALFDLVGRRWTLRIIWELAQAGRALRFSELQVRCDDMSSSVLAQRIADLRGAWVLDLSTEGYEITDVGADLISSMEPLVRWSRT
jgi:DNA-binding HxlR family transcriptional regulator